MILAILSLLAAPDIGPRPADLVPPGEEKAYAAALGAMIDRLSTERAGAPCPAGAAVKMLGLKPMGPASRVLGVRPSDPMDPRALVYREKVHITGCAGQLRVENIVVARETASWLMAPHAPGDTLGDLQLTHSVLQMAVPMATAGAADCPKPYELLDTTVVGQAPPGDVPWQERWRQASCGQDRTVLISFTPDGAGGTTFRVQPEWAEPAKP